MTKSLLVLGLVVPFLAMAAEKPAKRAAPKEIDYVTVETKSLSLSPKSESSVTLKFKVAPGFHIQANPASTPQLIPTTLMMPAANNLEVQSPLYPKGKPYKLKGSDSEISTYDGLVEIKVPVKTPEKIALNKFTWQGKLRYQACDEKTCFFPRNINFDIPVTVTK